MKFQILHGKHCIFVDGHPQMYQRGQILESNVDLAKRHNKPGSKRFARVADDAPVAEVEPAPVVVAAEDPSPVEPLQEDVAEVSPIEEVVEVPQTEDGVEQAPDVYTGLTVAELKQIAQDEEINLGDATRKADILKVLRSQNE